MDKLIIFYDDTKASCRKYAEIFAEYEEVECRKASDYGENQLVFAPDERIGLVFESENGKVPYVMSHVIWRLVAGKSHNHLLVVTGGAREFQAIRTAAKDMEERGYKVKNIYTRYLFEKYKITPDMAVNDIMCDLAAGDENILQREKLESMTKNMSKRELRKSFRRELKEYRKYKRKVSMNEI